MFAGDSGLFRSTDSGQTWTLYSLKNRIVNALATYKNYLFAGTDTGVFISSDSGMHWRYVSDSMGAQQGYHPNVKLLAVLDTLLFASVDAGINHFNQLDYGYITDRPISEMTDTTQASVVQTVPSGDSIEIYPNPAAGIVTILSGGTSILGVSVLNLLGEAVLDLPNLRESDIKLDISKLASGTYFFQINTDGGCITRRVVVMH